MIDIPDRKEKKTSALPLSKKRLAALFTISQKINSINTIKELLHEIVNIVITNLEAERGLIILTDIRGEELHVVASESFSDRSLSFSRSIVKTVLDRDQTVKSADLTKDAQFKNIKSAHDLNILSFICVPLKIVGEERPLGTLYIDQRIHKKIFTDEDVLFLESIANLAAIAINNTSLMEKLRTERVQLLEEVGKKYSLAEIIGQGKAMQKILAVMRLIINDDSTVLLTGESGTGKEVIARAMHFSSIRKDKPFIAINCGALPETLLETELFGSVRGAFTGAVDKQGLLQSAQSGTVFLDEIHHTSEAMQVKLLRFLQEREVRRVGGTKSVRVDVRLICASNEDLQKAVNDDKFRKDFFYRINIVTVNVPPLREHKEDIPLLAEHFLHKYCQEKNKKCHGFSKEALSALVEYDWADNNVRELENEIERLSVFMKNGATVELEDLAQKIQHKTSALEKRFDIISTALSFADLEKKYIRQVIEQAKGNKAKAARIMGIPRSTLQGKMKKLKLK